MTRSAAKAADLASGLGAIVLGAGLALLVPDELRGFAIPLLVAGILVHGVGMSLKHRFETRERAPLWWELALFWLCWVCLAGLAVWLLVLLLAPFERACVHLVRRVGAEVNLKPPYRFRGSVSWDKCRSLAGWLTSLLSRRLR